MDLFVYLLVLAVWGLIKTKAPADALGPILNNPGEAAAEMCVLPIGRNLSLLKERDAYTLILEELGLK